MRLPVIGPLLCRAFGHTTHENVVVRFDGLGDGGWSRRTWHEPECARCGHDLTEWLRDHGKTAGKPS